MNKALIIVIGLLLIFSGESVRSDPQEADARDEVQVLIDVSGSMKQNDPKNLRVEAGKLLISLLPEASKASIWLFAENTAPLTQSESVDAAWQKQALKDAARIHSRGLYTNIEDAIRTVLDNGFKGQGNKNLILLTDGVVDISKDIMVSADSRERILSEWIPKLQEQNIKVETIALSDQADKELLDKLAFDTGGWTESAQSAEQLQRAFLKMMQKAAPKDTLPLTGNQFAVDSGVKEFSVLAFKKPNSPPSQLLAPGQKKINKQTSSADVAWLENSAYDLITVKQPGVGDWRLEAETDPDNQVMIVTDLKMQLEELPNFIPQNEVVTLRVHFTDQGKTITRSDFLSMIGVSVSLDGLAPLNMPAEAAEPGIFALTFADLNPGKHSFKILADGKTFKRELQREIEVVAAPIAVEKVIDAERRRVVLKLTPDAALLDAATLAIDASIHRAGKPPETQVLEAKDGIWSLTLEDLAPGSETTVNFNASAKAPDGKPASVAITPVKIDDSLFLKKTAEPTPPPPEHVEPKAEVGTGEGKHHEQPTATNWWLIAGVVVAVNLLVLGGGFFIYRAIKKANAEKQKQILEKLS